MINKAIKLALKSKQKNKFNLCAIITDKKGNVVSIGYNSYSKTHTTQAYYAEKSGNIHRIFLHAEIDALTKIPYGIKGHSIYIARLDKSGKSALARPCPICRMALQDANIKNIYYTQGKE